MYEKVLIYTSRSGFAQKNSSSNILNTSTLSNVWHIHIKTFQLTLDILAVAAGFYVFLIQYHWQNIWIKPRLLKCISYTREDATYLLKSGAKMNGYITEHASLQFLEKHSILVHLYFQRIWLDFSKKLLFGNESFFSTKMSIATLNTPMKRIFTQILR